MADKTYGEDEERLEVEEAELGEARRREDVALAADFVMTRQDLRARQAAMGEHRRYAGPVFEDAEALPAALDAASEEEDVEPTEIAPTPEESEGTEETEGTEPDEW